MMQPSAMKFCGWMFQLMANNYKTRLLLISKYNYSIDDVRFYTLEWIIFV